MCKLTIYLLKKIDKILLNENYVPDNEISTTLYLSFFLENQCLLKDLQVLENTVS